MACLAINRLNYIIDQRGDPDLSNSNQLSKMLLDLMHYQNDDLVQHSLLLMDRYYSSQSDIFQKALHLQLLVTEKSVEVYNTVESLLTDLTAYLRAGLGSVSCGSESSPLQVLTKFCWLEGEAAGYEIHEINQKIILSFGMDVNV